MKGLLQSRAGALSLVLVAGAVVTTCYRPRLVDCAVACAADGAPEICPHGMSCSNGLCTSGGACPAPADCVTPCGDGDACPGGMTCSGGLCSSGPACVTSAIACEGGDLRCAGDVVQSCGADGRWRDQHACTGAAPVCRRAACVVCGAGEARCTVEGARQVCGAEGDWAPAIACVAPATCRSGICTAPAPGSGPGPGVASIVAGASHTCAILAAGGVSCWGKNDAGQLGRGNGAPGGGDARPRPVVGLEAPATPPVLALALGQQHSCALLQGGIVRCWGGNARGQLGLGDRLPRAAPATVDLGAGRTAIAIAAGVYHTCVLVSDGHVVCFGLNEFGQLGIGSTDSRGDDAGEAGEHLRAADLGSQHGAQALASGAYHTCATLDDGRLKCWGLNEKGQLGLGDAAPRGQQPSQMGDKLAAVDLGAGRTAVGVVAGASHTCALLDDGSVRCWGANQAGQLGIGDSVMRGTNGTTVGDFIPAVHFGAGEEAVSLAAGADHTCALLRSGRIRCWGLNDSGQLGLGKAGNQSTVDDIPPVALGTGTGSGAAPLTARSIAAGHFHTCATLDDGTAKCWGQNGSGQLGVGDLVSRGIDAAGMGDKLPAIALGDSAP